jgi:uncharacterized membrane protein YkvI
MVSSRFQRFLLPGFAFKAVVIGGGYATGRELAEYFLGSGPAGGALGMVVSLVCWSVLCAATFLFAYVTGSHDFGSFFRHLLGRGAILFDFVYGCFLLIVLSVFGAAAGELGHSVFNWPAWLGTVLLVFSIAAVVSFGNRSVEALFRYVTYFLYAVYFSLFVLSVSEFGEPIAHAFATVPPSGSWWLGGMTYAGYNAIGAAAILPVLRHLQSRRDAVVAGVLAGALGMLPALLFFISMSAFYPQIAAATLPSDYLLQRLNAPVFHLFFQCMIFAALLESGAGIVHGANERIAAVLSSRDVLLSRGHRLAIGSILLITSVWIATEFGLVALVARGYRLLAVMMLVVYVVPVLTVGVWRVMRSSGVMALDGTSEGAR